MSQHRRTRTPTAVALVWNHRDAPVVSAQGKNATAEQILAIARQHDIPLYEDAGLAQLLMQLELGEQIPESLYHIIAEVIAFAYYISGQTSISLK